MESKHGHPSDATRHLVCAVRLNPTRHQALLKWKGIKNIGQITLSPRIDKKLEAQLKSSAGNTTSAKIARQPPVFNPPSSFLPSPKDGLGKVVSPTSNFNRTQDPHIAKRNTWKVNCSRPIRYPFGKLRKNKLTSSGPNVTDVRRKVDGGGDGAASGRDRTTARLAKEAHVSRTAVANVMGRT